MSRVTGYALRLGPGEELKSALLRVVKDNNLQNAFIMTCVGSLERITIRFANGGPDKPNEVKTLEQRMEIVSLVGTIDRDLGCHIHISLSDDKGVTWGGHLVENAIVFTTAEIVIGALENVVFTREQDDQTGFPELVVKTTN